METLTHGGALLVAATREPTLLIVWGVVIGIMLGGGRGAGLPLLFWHERRGVALRAGIAATVLTAEIFFVLYLIAAAEPGRASAGLGLGGHMVVGGALWMTLVLWHALHLARAGRAGGEGAAASAPGPVGVTPRVQPVVAVRTEAGGRRDEIGAPRATRISPWPFVAGVLITMPVVASAVIVDRTWLGPQIEASVRVHALRFPWLPGGDLHLHVLAAATAVILLALFWLMRRKATPAVGLCLFLTLLAATYGFVTFWTGSRGLLMVIGFLLLLLAGRNPYRLRLPALAARYPGAGTPAPYPPPADAPGPPGDPPLLVDCLASARLGGALAAGTAARPARRPLILICASIRAAAWTAGVLGRLDALPGFRGAARMLTGASGGMVGAACWLAWCHARAAASPDAPVGAGPDDWRTLLRCAGMDSLTASTRRLFFRDLPMAFWPGSNLHDRARAMEDAWIAAVAERLGARLDMPIAALRDGEARGLWPSVVFSPMLIEDGRRLIISNLDLRDVLVNQARWMGAGGAGATDTSSVAAYHAAALFPAEWPVFPLSTAARLSAAFPYVSPAVVLPTAPRRRVVDAGYYDNYGVDLACGWLREALSAQRDWLAAHVSRVLVLQIRDNVSDLSVNPDSETERRQAALRAASGQAHGAGGSALARGIEGLSSPPEALLAAMDSVALFRNDAQLETVTHLYEAACGRADFVTTAAFEFKGEASLSWYLTQDEIAGLEAQVASDAIQGKVAAIGRWLEAGGADGALDASGAAS